MTDRYTILQGECLKALAEIGDATVDAVITDPPYSSGGFTRDDKGASVQDKYQQSETVRRFPDFGGDSRDQRSYLAWCALWIDECMRVLKPGGYFLAFTDWRQLPVMTDAIQCGGVFWRGIVAWNKGQGARAPHKGYFRHQCEYIVWGTKGKAQILEHDGPFPGYHDIDDDAALALPPAIYATVIQTDKHHITGKPTALMKELVRVVPPDGQVLDPFMGSGTTGVAAVLMGRRFIGVERSAEYCDIARARIEAAAHGQTLQAELGEDGGTGQVDLFEEATT